MDGIEAQAMTYADQFLRNKWAQIATQVGHAARKSPEWMHSCAMKLHDFELSREKPTSRDHLIQIATKWAHQ